jgi:hypothetical protein
MRAAFQRDFLGTRSAKRSEISVPSIQSFAKDKLLGIVGLKFKFRFELSQYIVIAIIVVFLLILPGLMFLVQQASSR